MVKGPYTSFAVNHIYHIHEISNLLLVRLYKWREDDDYPTFLFALDGCDYGNNTVDIYHIDGTWKMNALVDVDFDYVLLASGIVPFIHFLNCHAHEVDFNEIRKTFGIEEEDE